MKCPYCGSEMREDAVLCTACGKLTPEYERKYRRPDPTVGRGSAAAAPRSYDPTVGRTAETTPSRPPRQLLLLVIGAIAALAVFSLFLGYLIPADTTEEVRSAVDEEYIPEYYTEALNLYFEALSENNTGQIRALHPEAIRDEAFADWDVLSDRYGSEVSSYEILSREMYDPLETAAVESRLGEDVSFYERVTVKAMFADDSEPVMLEFSFVITGMHVNLYEVQFSNSD